MMMMTIAVTLTITITTAIFIAGTLSPAGDIQRRPVLNIFILTRKRC